MTTVRDMDNDNAVLGDLITRIDAGTSIGPRMPLAPALTIASSAARERR